MLMTRKKTAMSVITQDIDINFEDDRWSSAYEELCQRAILACMKQVNPSFSSFEISIVLADDAFVQRLNKEYRGKDKPTNVLSFPQHEPEELKSRNDFTSLGDIILAYETVKKESLEQSKSMEMHTSHLIVHGFLHLLGYDHIEDSDAEEMEALEIKTLKTLGIKNPYESGAIMA